jgi:hypothetical protein
VTSSVRVRRDTTGLLAERRRHSVGSRARRKPPRLEHDDLLSGGPRLVRKHERHPRGLARTGRRDQHRGIACAQRVLQRRQSFVNRQVDIH